MAQAHDGGAHRLFASALAKYVTARDRSQIKVELPLIRKSALGSFRDHDGDRGPHE
jgi:hypothetical protein